MSNKNLIVNTPEPKPGILERGDLFAIAVGMVIGSGMVTLIGPAMAMTGYSVWLAYLTAIVMGFFMVFPYIMPHLKNGIYSLPMLPDIFLEVLKLHIQQSHS